jgi:hypothetical protein
MSSTDRATCQRAIDEDDKRSLQSPMSKEQATKCQRAIDEAHHYWRTEYNNHAGYSRERETQREGGGREGEF